VIERHGRVAAYLAGIELFILVGGGVIGPYVPPQAAEELR